MDPVTSLQETNETPVVVIISDSTQYPRLAVPGTSQHVREFWRKPRKCLLLPPG